MIACNVSYTYPTRGLTLRMVPSIPGQVHKAFPLPPSGSLGLGRVPGHFSRRGAGSTPPPRGNALRKVSLAWPHRRGKATRKSGKVASTHSR